MSLSFNSAEARKADNFASVIRDTGKYVGIITRAEKLLSRNNVEGVGLSFKTDNGATANYLDVYTVRADGSQLRGYHLIQALLCCSGVKEVAEGPIKFEKWTRDQGIVETTVTGYPALMGRRIGLILQKELSTHRDTGADVERVNIVAVFQATTGLTATEILDGKTKAEKTDERMKALQPVRDSRVKSAAQRMAAPARDVSEFDDIDDIKF